MYNPYSILGCSPTDSLATIKRIYRDLIKEYHPDCIKALGARSELVELATKEFHIIDEAYKSLINKFKSSN